MARKQADNYENKQRSILTSAAAVIAEAGMENASMSQIAVRGNVSKALLYHYYPSKAALIFDIVQTHLAELDETLAAADKPDAPAEERLGLLVLAVIKNYQHSNDQHKVQLNCVGTLNAEQMETLHAIERSITRRFSGVLRTIAPELEKDRSYLMPTTMSLFGMLNWMYLWFRDDGSISREEYAKLVTNLMLNGMKGI
ncbi:TetR/AcrR family transcriptional regulator [Granulosicoccus antarcticus]|uniref:HTH-type transcriptional regulator BetI n=1 Tax=Granulosicoccus antarcticus IMCC3135 TaxID=1192854 RepID=A0A2Z2NZG8_9GAMM|nr:TetR/AcrR family transcriptional regulator [Granulosicoccus antarcticus]ASJ76826.1 HTH-type transcriptional regulator BetI [Granulosicoccus antarcticus IMCC3135]